MLDVAVIPGVPVEEDADELVAAPDAVGLEMRVAESAVVTRAVPAFAVGEGGFVKRPCFGPALVRALFARYESQLLCHGFQFSARYGKFRIKPNFHDCPNEPQPLLRRPARLPGAEKSPELRPGDFRFPGGRKGTLRKKIARRGSVSGKGVSIG